jgi:Holliday junction DNA helicase RuvA
MFNSIQGTITEKVTDSIRIDTGGIEWDIAMPATDLDALPTPGNQGRVFVWLYHKEDSMRLFGFADEVRRATFLDLLKVEGIGPRGALKIMGGIGQNELERALDTEDISRLESIPGLGKKTAQKMILSLKGKLASVQTVSATSSPRNELLEALLQMGYDRRSALEALARAESALNPALNSSDREKALFKQAIVLLSTGHS